MHPCSVRALHVHMHMHMHMLCPPNNAHLLDALQRRRARRARLARCREHAPQLVTRVDGARRTALEKGAPHRGAIGGARARRRHAGRRSAWPAARVGGGRGRGGCGRERQQAGAAGVATHAGTAGVARHERREALRARALLGDDTPRLREGAHAQVEVEHLVRVWVRVRVRVRVQVRRTVRVRVRFRVRCERGWR